MVKMVLLASDHTDCLPLLHFSNPWGTAVGIDTEHDMIISDQFIYLTDFLEYPQELVPSFLLPLFCI